MLCVLLLRWCVFFSVTIVVVLLLFCVVVVATIVFVDVAMLAVV